MSSSTSQSSKPAIVLAHFGTTVPSAMISLVNVQRVVRAAFPGVELRIAFTSNIIRGIWRKRRAEREAWLSQDVPRDVLDVQGTLGTIGALQDEGYRSILVQPTHIFHGEQYEDLKSYVRGLQSIETTKKRWMPFETLAISRPVLGTHGPDRDYREDVAETVKILSGDVERAVAEDAALVYAGHGNEYFSTGVFGEFERCMRQTYPQVKTYVGMVEGRPGRSDVMGALARDLVKRVVLKPLMVTAGDHAQNDLDGDRPESWRSQLQAAGYQVLSIMEGLGTNDAFAQLYVNRITDTAERSGIALA